jgi:hypothetical protein
MIFKSSNYACTKVKHAPFLEIPIFFIFAQKLLSVHKGLIILTL